jgi:hypothetical protein
MHFRPFFFFFIWLLMHFPWFDSTDGCLVPGSTFDRVSCAGVACLISLVFYLLRRPPSIPYFLIFPPPFLTVRCVSLRDDCQCIITRCAHTSIDMYGYSMQIPVGVHAYRERNLIPILGICVVRPSKCHTAPRTSVQGYTLSLVHMFTHFIHVRVLLVVK